VDEVAVALEDAVVAVEDADPVRVVRPTMTKDSRRARLGPGGGLIVFVEDRVDLVVGHVGDVEVVEQFGHPKVVAHTRAVQAIEGVAVAAFDIGEPGFQGREPASERGQGGHVFLLLVGPGRTWFRPSTTRTASPRRSPGRG